jgi:ketosteroid isomerase-like protein
LLKVQRNFANGPANMRTLSLACGMIAASSAIAHTQPSNTCAATPAAAEQQVRKLEADWTDAFARQDVAFFERTLADEFILVGGGPDVESRASFFDEMRRQKSAGEPVRPYQPDSGTMRVRAYGDVVVVTGTATYPPTRSTEKAFRVRYTEVFVCRAKRWQAVHGHYSEVPTASDTAKRGGG